MLRLQDLEEMIDEEYLQVDEFGTSNMSPENLERALEVYTERQADKQKGYSSNVAGATLVGEPYY